MKKAVGNKSGNIRSKRQWKAKQSITEHVTDFYSKMSKLWLCLNRVPEQSEGGLDETS